MRRIARGRNEGKVLRWDERHAGAQVRGFAAHYIDLLHANRGNSPCCVTAG
jgi:hypothetical protein